MVRSVYLKARLHRRFLSRQLDAIFVAGKLHQVSNMFETPAIWRRQIALKIAPGLHVQFRSCNFNATKIASSCRDKNRLCKRAFRLLAVCFSLEISEQIIRRQGLAHKKMGRDMGAARARDKPKGLFTLR